MQTLPATPPQLPNRPLAGGRCQRHQNGKGREAGANKGPLGNIVGNVIQIKCMVKADKGQKMQQLDSIISAKGQTAWSTVVLGKVDNKLLTLQVTLPADNQQQAQTAAENIVNTLVIK